MGDALRREETTLVLSTEFKQDFRTTASRLLRSEAQEGDGSIHVHLLNAYSMCVADGNVDYQAALNDSSAVNLCDGKSVELAAKMLHGMTKLRQMRGPDFFRTMLNEGRETNLRHCFLGSTPSVLEKLVRQAEEMYPGVQIACAISPPFREPTAQELAERDALILASGANIIWVGLGTPKQDFEAHRVTTATGINSVAIGAAFDFLAGTTKEAPRILRGSGLEWLYRLISEPRRLWRRYLFGNIFIVV